MRKPDKQDFSVSFDHDGEKKNILVEIQQSKMIIRFDDLQSLDFTISFDRPETFVVSLPTDRKGKRPTAEGDVASFPELTSALEELKHLRWMAMKSTAND
ncbi:hypothetical protein [Pseudomonas sp. 2FE]|uniref:hypothetical protein n=1 Tax=Pseudomonas sp. 2FE TaxID=2502190 RepID=UPI0010F7BA26|nr:hypothetical protein [Pseudomonas sp. 2FE]